MPTTDLHATDVLGAAAALADTPGTLLLHDGRPAGRRILLFSPRWTVQRSGVGTAKVQGAAPRDLGLDPLRPLSWPTQLQSRRPSPVDDVPWIAGYFAFEAGLPHHGVEPAPSCRFTVPEVWLAAYDRALVQTGDGPMRLIVRDLGALTTDVRPGETRREEALAQLATRSTVPAGGAIASPAFLDPAWHRASVEAVRDHLRRGDVYQINLTGAVTARTTIHPFEGFRREVATNPTEFAAYLRLDEGAITSHSPELLLRVRGTRLETAPIKGTAPTDHEDALLASPKDRAEHIMIVDLCRNDLGRIATTGSVRVDPLMNSLRLRGLTHLVSHVHATLDPARRHDVLEALFPGGSITGAPKRRALEIIRTLEPERRGPYTGTIGGIAPDGRQDWSIAIRTAVWQDGAVHFGSGGGIVLDSDADHEYEEARLKARSFFASLGASLDS